MIKRTLLLILCVCLFPLLLHAQNAGLTIEKPIHSTTTSVQYGFEQSNIKAYSGKYSRIHTSEISQVFNPSLLDLQQHTSSEINHDEITARSIFSKETETVEYSKSRALGYAAIFPGIGHLHSKQSRGYLYLAGGVIAVGMYAESYLRFLDAESKGDNALRLYNSATNSDQAAFFRSEIFRLRDDKKKFERMAYFSLGLFAAIYTAQLIDLYLTSPTSSGNKSKLVSRFQAGVAPGAVQLNFTF